MGTRAAAADAGCRRPGRRRRLGAALGAALVLVGGAGVTGQGDRPEGPWRAAPAAAPPGQMAINSPERVPSPPGTAAVGEVFEIVRAVPAPDPAPACSVRRVPAAGGAAPGAVVVYREDLVAALVDVCGAGWAFAPAAAAVAPPPESPTGDAPWAPAGAGSRGATGVR
jgi:hypothetical protein